MLILDLYGIWSAWVQRTLLESWRVSVVGKICSHYKKQNFVCLLWIIMVIIRARKHWNSESNYSWNFHVRPPLINDHLLWVTLTTSWGRPFHAFPLFLTSCKQSIDTSSSSLCSLYVNYNRGSLPRRGQGTSTLTLWLLSFSVILLQFWHTYTK